MIKVAIVGNIASGKSTVEKFLMRNGYPVLDTDMVCHDLLERVNEVKTEFAQYDVFKNGVVSREKLGKLVFTDSVAKKKLEDILYPHVRVEILRFFVRNSNSKYVFASVPQLYEAGMEDLFDKVLFVYCDDDMRFDRLISRNHYSAEYAKIRMDAQLPQNEKANKADWVVYNNSTVEELEEQISKLIV